MVSVSSISATSISLSWSVASGRVASWEVVWRPTDRGIESTSGSLPGNTYTIHHLDSSTIYTVTVTATNAAGTTESTHMYFSTGNEEVLFIHCKILAATDANHTGSTSFDLDNIPAIIGGVIVALVFIVATSLTILGIVLLVLRSPKGNYSTSTAKQGIFGALYFYTSSCVIELFTVMQLVVQINHWSSPCSQRHEFV